jgi:hypothetical protein
MSLFLYLIVVTVLFLFYVESSVGGIIYRVSSSGIMTFQLSGAFYYLINPLYNSFLWNWRLLDVNYIFVIILSLIIYHNQKLIF